MPEKPSMTTDHWWWRPGWRLGRSFYTWHVTFTDEPSAADLARDFAPLIAELPTMDEVGSRGLHVTVQGVGFTDEVDASDLEEIISAAHSALSRTPAGGLTFGPPFVDAETIQLGTRDSTPLMNIRTAIQDAIGAVWGAEKTPERGDSYRPHLTVAYSNGTASIAEVEDRMLAHGLTGRTFDLPVRAVSLIELNRNHKRYEWRELAVVPLAAAGVN